MANTFCVQPNSSHSALGAGTVEDFENELIEAPEEEEEFDVLNDETFGECTTAGSFDWEEEHERLAVGLEGETFSDVSCRENTKDYGNTERSFRSQEEYLEQSISRLMVEDEEEEENQHRGKGQPIPGLKGQPHLEHLFGPASPPALLDTEQLISPASKNIWGSPARGDVFRKPADALQKLFDSAKAGHPPGFESPVPNALLSLHHTSPAALPQAHTLEEIERQMLGRNKKPQVMTAEELERHFRGDTSLFTQKNTNHPHPPIHSSPQFRPGLLPASVLGDNISPFSISTPIRPLRLPMQPLPQAMKSVVGINPLIPPPVSNGRSSPIAIMASGKLIHQPPMQSSSPHFTPGRSPSSPLGTHTSTPTPPLVPSGVTIRQSFHPARLMSPYSLHAASVTNGPATGNMVNHRIGSQLITPRPTVRGIPSSGVDGTPSGSRMPSPQIMQDLSQNIRGQRSVGDRQYESPNSINEMTRRYDTTIQQGNNRIPYEHCDRHRDYRNNYQRPPPWQQHQHQMQHPVESHPEGEDEYCGLMTRREKDWIIKIQLLQLHTDNPYLDDYYYTYYMLHKKRRESCNGRGDAETAFEPKLLIPNLAKIETRAYTPAHFEGSLGRLTTASVHNPRHIIDVTRSASPTEDPSKKSVSKELRKFRQLLMDIEKGYVLLLDIDDVEKKVLALPEESRLPLLIEHAEKIHLLYEYFTCDESIEQYTQILSIRKGRKLLARVLPYFNKNQAHVPLCILFHHLYNLIKKDTPDEGLSVMIKSVCGAIEGSNLESLVRLVNILKGEKPFPNVSYLHPLFGNQFSAAVLCGLIQQGEQIYRDTSPVDMDNHLHTEWVKFVEEFGETLENEPLNDLAFPAVSMPLVQPHLTRLLNTQLLMQLEDKVQRLTTLPAINNIKSES